MKNNLLKNIRILLVEDEENIAKLLKFAIGGRFYSFSLAKNAKEGLEKFMQISPDIVITDINMPSISGLEMAKELKKINPNIPIIVLSAFSNKEKLLDAIDIGIIKYFLKPYDPEEILEYISSLANKLSSKIITFCDDFSFNKTSNALYKSNKYISLSKNENKFITLLIANEIVDNDTIKKMIWGENVSNERLRTFLKRLREKTSKNLIVNIRGVGYKLCFSKD
jgi:DNA-binding response OmpR family regulator